MKREKQILVFVFAVLFVFSSVAMAMAEVVEIGSAEQLAAFRNRVNSGESTLDAKLTSDIDLGGDFWEPIGQMIPVKPDSYASAVSADYSYRGKFDGAGHGVSNFKVTSEQAVYVYLGIEMRVAAGFFGVLSADAAVSNLHLENISVDVPMWADSMYVHGGGLAGVNRGGAIENVSVTGADILVLSYAGGIVGWNDGTVKNSSVCKTGTITGDYVVGGIVGENEGTIANASVNEVGTMKGIFGIGGVAGKNSGAITDSRVNGIQTFESDTCSGGIVGSNVRSGVVANCIANGIETISSGKYAGGIVGLNNGTVKHSLAREVQTIVSPSSAGGAVAFNDEKGIVTNNDVSRIGKIDGVYSGGIAGTNNGTVKNGAVSEIGHITHHYAGGIVGQNNGPVADCSVSGIGLLEGSYAGGITALDFSGFDNCVVRDVSLSGTTSAGGLAANIRASRIRNSIVFRAAIATNRDDSDIYSGALVGYNCARVQNCAVVDMEEKSVSAKISGDNNVVAYAGGAFGFQDDPQDSFTDCLFPAGIVDTEGVRSAPDEWAIGNIPWGDMGKYENIQGVNAYAATSPPEQLPAIAAMFAQGVSVEVEKGKTYELNIETLPGTVMADRMKFKWASENDKIVTVSPNSGAIVTLKGLELGTTNVTCKISGNLESEMTCAVTVVAARADTGSKGSSSSCASLPGALALLALAALPLVARRR